MSTTQQITTADQLFRATGLGRCELLRGELVMMTPAGYEHGRIAAAITVPLGGFVTKNALGDVLGAETGFRIERKTGSMGIYNQIATVSANATSYSDTGLDEETTYYYRVAAYNPSGNSGYSNDDKKLDNILKDQEDVPCHRGYFRLCQTYCHEGGGFPAFNHE